MASFDQQIMARTAYGEARGEGDIGMQAVMWTGLNRFTSRRWFSGRSIAGTLLKYEQYDCWMAHDPNYAVIINLTDDNGTLKQALLWAAQIIAGMTVDPTQGATHYYADTIAAPDWTKEATFTVKIGRHLFYKNVE